MLLTCLYNRMLNKKIKTDYMNRKKLFTISRFFYRIFENQREDNFITTSSNIL